MAKTALLFALSFISALTLAQNENSHMCSKRDAFGVQMKSASLSVNQIAETERYDVHFYALDLEMSNLSTDVAGTGEIHGTAREALDSVLFELYDGYTISDIRLNGVSSTYSRVGTAIKVPVNITQGTNFAIEIDYSGTPPNGASTPFGGSGMSNDSSPTWGNQVTWSLSEPFSAYEWWPCKQSLTDKADSCAVKLTVPDNCMAGSNGLLEAVVDLGNGTKRFEWMHRHPIDYYLISVAVAEYVEYNVYANPTGAPNPILIQNFIYDNPATLTNFQNEIDETADFVELFSDLYGMYPFADEKYGHCMAPLSGGMEHQTMTTQGFFVKSLTAHELGHQWWGDNITCASWSDIWVNEGFASYSEYLMLENMYPNETTLDMQDRHDNIMSSPGGSVWVLDSLNEGRIFSGRLTYDKGAAILHTFRFILDDDAAFFNALQNLQVNFADSTMIGLDVKEELEASSGLNLTDAFQEWYFGEGYPTYSARWNTIGSDLILEVTHTTSSSTPTFTNPLEIQFSRVIGVDTTIRVDIASNLEQYVIPNLGNANSLVSIDPNNWIINEVGTTVKDPNFTLAIQNLELKDDYVISPNPSNGNYLIETEMSGEHAYSIFDTRGRLIENGSFENAIQLDLTQQLNGNYIVQLTNNSGEKRVKILVKN
ncbi:MAG: T9SS type A sorting domain-containing protein [Flavobacteriales bacterium]|nr:T9SS type A sorting domain-containing protein [Flavobacteriales bacterium]